MSPIYIVTFSLLLFPSLGLFLGYITRNHPIIRRCIVYPIFLIAMVAIIAGILGLSTIHIGMDLILYSSLYLSISLVLWYIFFKKSRVLATLLMLIIYTFGYIFSLVLPLTSDLVPKVIVRLDENTIYKEYSTYSEYSGKEVEIYRVYGNLFEKKIFIKSYYDEAPAFVNDTLKLNYKPEEKELILSIPDDENKYMYTFHKNFDKNWKDTIVIESP